MNVLTPEIDCVPVNETKLLCVYAVVATVVSLSPNEGDTARVSPAKMVSKSGEYEISHHLSE